MSENPPGEKQFEPTSKRLLDLRKKGTVLRAKDFTGGMSLLFAIFVLLYMSEDFLRVMTQNFDTVLKSFEPEFLGKAQLGRLILSLAVNNLMLLLPLGVGLIGVALFSTYILSGGLGFSTEVLQFKAERLNPMKNLKNMFAPNKVFELLKSMLKVGLFGGFFVVFLYLYQIEIITLSTTNDSHILVHGFVILKDFFYFMMPPILLLAFFDATYSYFTHQKKVKMTFQEIKDEQKESDGSPEMKGKRRSQQQELARRRMQQVVPVASVIITNPTHYAVALKYNDEDKAPKIVAKGVDFMAKEIKLLAIKNAVPIYEAPPLARAIYFTGKVGSYIHKDLYRSVAMVLAYVMQLKSYQQGMGEAPLVPGDLEVPDDFKF